MMTLRLKPAHRLICFGVCLLAIVSVYGAEVFLHMRIPEPIWETVKSKSEITRLAAQFGSEFDTRDTSEVIADFRKDGIDAVPQILVPMLKRQKDGTVKSAISINGAEVMPLGGIARKLTVACNQNGQYLVYKADEHGFHNPEGVWKTSRLDIAAVGNSRALGFCVPSDKNFVALIRNRYPATLNLGMAGEGPLQILGVLKEYLQTIQPKLVLWFYFEGNNLSELQGEKQSPILMRYLEDDFKQDLRARQNEIDLALARNFEEQKDTNAKAAAPARSPTMFRDLKSLIKLRTLRTKFGLVRQKPRDELDLEGPTVDLFGDILRRAKVLVESWGGTLYFVYLPQWTRYGGELGPNERQREIILQLVKTMGLPIADVEPAFRAHNDPMSLFPFRRPGHYNEAGHRLVGEEVLKNIGLRVSQPFPSRRLKNEHLRD